jgi:acetyltransferase-like isoleucine patch superfamily enzyme
MMQVNLWVEKIIRYLKQEPNYHLPNDYSLKQYGIIVFERGFQILRGLTCKIWFGKSKGLIFCGKNVKVKHGNLLKAGENLILEDNAFLNALSASGIELGNNVTIGRNSILICTGVIKNKGVGIKIGDNTGINAHAYLGGQGGIAIGSNVIIGPYVKIFSENHIFANPTIPIKQQGESRKGVVIQDNCWIGAGVTILDGVTIESGVVVAAGAVVTRSIPANTVAGGIPAQIIKSR